MTEFAQKQNDDEAGQMHIADVWSLVVEVVWNYKWWYLVSILTCAGVMVFYLYRTPPVYQMTAKVIIDESDQEAAMRSIGPLAAAGINLQAGTSVANEMQALASPDIMQEVVVRLHLEPSYVARGFLRDVELYSDTPLELRLAGDNPQSHFSFVVGKLDDKRIVLKDFAVGSGSDKVEDVVECFPGDTVNTPAGRIVLYPTSRYDELDYDLRVSWNNSRAVAKSIDGRLSVARSGKESTVVELTLRDHFPSRANEILTSLIDIYNEEWIRSHNESARNTSAFINERLVIIERELGGIENDLRKYKQDNKLTDMGAISKAYIEETSEYSSKEFDVTNQLSVAQYIKDYLNNPVNESALIPANLGLTSANVETQIGEYNNLILQRDRLSKGSGANNPIIADLNNSIASLRSAILRSVDNAIATLQLQARKIQAQEEQIMARIALNSDQELQLLSIQRQQMVKESLYVFLLQKREENELASLVNVGNTRMIMRPDGPSSPVSPKRMMYMMAALVLGFGLPFGIIILRRLSDTTVKSKSDFEGLSMSFLGEIPLSVRKNKLGIITKAKSFNNENCRIIVTPGSRDMMNEAFRVLRTNFDMVIDRQPGKAFVSMFTSFNPNAGKTFIIQNLAASQAVRNARVLLLDLDLRKATLSKALGKETRGVASYLGGRQNDVLGLVGKVSEGLYVLPVGKLPPNPTELILTQRFREMMEVLRTEFDYIFVDCPPIDLVADAAIVTKVVDMTIFVARASLLDRRDVPHLEEMYLSGRFSRMAVVLNGVDIESRGYRSYGYRYGYGYGNEM